MRPAACPWVSKVCVRERLAARQPVIEHSCILQVREARQGSCLVPYSPHRVSVTMLLASAQAAPADVSVAQDL